MSNRKDETERFVFKRLTEEGETIRMLTDSDMCLPELLSEFEFFLKGCGYHFKGTLEIVEEDPSEK